MISFLLILLTSVNAFSIRGNISKTYPVTFDKSIVQILKGQSTNSDFKHSCTGSIIDEFTVLTAAHCFDDENFNLKIIYNNTEYKPVEILIHESYKREDIRHEHWGFVYDIKIQNDIALIKTASRFPLEFIYLAPENFQITQDTNLYISGFGQTANIFGLGSGEGFYRVSTLTHSDRISKDRIVINDGASGGCQGDSGGPLWGLTDSGWAQVAITSQGDCNVQTQFERVNVNKILNAKYKSHNL